MLPRTPLELKRQVLPSSKAARNANRLAAKSGPEARQNTKAAEAPTSKFSLSKPLNSPKRWTMILLREGRKPPRIRDPQEERTSAGKLEAQYLRMCVLVA